MKIVYDRIADRPPLNEAAHRRAVDIGTVFDGEPGVELRWELHTERVPRELVLVAEDTSRRAEEPITATELFDGNGTFHEKLLRMKDSLATNGHWRVGARKLIDECEKWGKALGATAERFSVALNEEHHGRYDLPALKLGLNTGTVRIAPLAGRIVPPVWLDELRKDAQREIGCARFTGSDGSLEVYLLFPSGKWAYQYAILDRTHAPQGYSYLDQMAFEKLLRVCTDE